MLTYSGIMVAGNFRTGFSYVKTIDGKYDSREVRMERHLRMLGLFHVIYGALGFLGSYSLSYLLGGSGRFFGLMNSHALYGHSVCLGGGGFLHFIGVNLAGLMALLGLAGIVAGCGLMSHKNWARVTVMVLGIIALINIPLGTALGIYTLWVVTKPEVKELTLSRG